MTIALDSTGGFFTRLGRLAAGVNEATALVGATTDARIALVAAEYASNEQSDLASIWSYRDAFRESPQGWLSNLFDLATTTLVDQADRDVALLNRTLSDAIAELIRQMDDASESLNRPTIGNTVTAHSGNTGDTSLLISTTDGDGLQLDCVFAETLRAVVSSDRGLGATEFSESIQITGDAAASELDYDWPRGSGATSFVTTVDPAQSSLILNGSFEDFTVTNIPDSWTIDVGTVTTHVARQASPRRGTYCVRFISDGATLVALKQAPVSSLTPKTLYAVTLSAKISATTATGALRISLWDDDLDAVINDAEGNANSSTLSVNGGSGVDTTYKQFTAFFRTPAKVPTNAVLRIDFSTAPTSGRTVDIDLVALTQPTQLYSGGPYAVAFSNVTSPIVGDSWSIAITNSLGTSSLVRNCDRFFQTRLLGVKLPTSGSPTVSDSLVA